MKIGTTLRKGIVVGMLVGVVAEFAATTLQAAENGARPLLPLRRQRCRVPAITPGC